MPNNAEQERRDVLKQLDREIDVAPPGMRAKEEKTMSSGKPGERKLTDEQIAAIKAAPNESAAKVSERTGIAPHLISYWRAKLKKQSGVRPVTVDPKRPGAAASLDRALARVDQKATSVVTAAQTVNATETVRIELTLDEARAILGKLSDKQGAVFFAAGLRAALLA